MIILRINWFYKVYGYSCFYQTDTENVFEIQPQEVTITFICNHYPRTMIQHLQKYRDLKIHKEGAGIYYITGDEFPIQLLITKELNPEENLWLQSLRKDVKGKREIEFLLKTYEGKKHSKLISGCNGCNNQSKLESDDGGERKYVWCIKRIDGKMSFRSLKNR